MYAWIRRAALMHCVQCGMIGFLLIRIFISLHYLCEHCFLIKEFTNKLKNQLIKRFYFILLFTQKSYWNLLLFHLILNAMITFTLYHNTKGNLRSSVKFHGFSDYWYWLCHDKYTQRALIRSSMKYLYVVVHSLECDYWLSVSHVFQFNCGLISLLYICMQQRDFIHNPD